MAEFYDVKIKKVTQGKYLTYVDQPPSSEVELYTPTKLYAIREQRPVIWYAYRSDGTLHGTCFVMVNRRKIGRIPLYQHQTKTEPAYDIGRLIQEEKKHLTVRSRL